jgi:hypothetical protein
MAETSGIKLVRYYIQKLKAFFLSKDILSFLIFFALAATFWFANALGKEKETNIVIPIRYVNVPLDIAYTNVPPSQISFTINDQGLRLLSSYSKDKLSPLLIDMNRVYAERGEIVINSQQLKDKISSFLLPTTTLLNLNLDSILITYEKLSSKVLPIRLISNFELANQHMISNHTFIEPESVTVFGHKNTLDTLTSVYTELIAMKNMDDTVMFKSKLKPIKSIRYSSEDIKVTVYVEPFTEKKVQIPISIINCPSNLIIRPFPAVVEVKYNVGLSNFNKYSSDDLTVELDYNLIKNSSLMKHKLKINNKKRNISNIRISPQEVEFILESK